MSLVMLQPAVDDRGLQDLLSSLFPIFLDVCIL